jgi:ankyrin repeat protein
LVIARPLVPDLDEPSVPVGRWLDRQVELLREAYDARELLALNLLRGCGVVEGSDDELWAVGLTLDVARDAVACDHSYGGWSEVQQHVHDQVDTRFEAAADAIQWGDVKTLRLLLDEDPDLVRRRSPFPHGAMLLHYVAANGVERERQIQSPPNAVDVMHLLLERGAAPDATCAIYGDGNTTMYLLVSSAHPARAGVQAPLVEELCRRGANPDGPVDDGFPLWTAISFGYREAAEALVRCGAGVENLVFAAALGDLETVKGYFQADGRPKPDLGRNVDRMGMHGPLLAREHLVDYALIWAAGHNRRDVVEFLLTKGPDLTVREPCFGATAAGYARHAGNDEIVAILDPLTPRS